MILRPEFYAQENIDRLAVRRELGLATDLRTGIVLFGGYGSKVMYDTAEKLDASQLSVQLILICGRNEKLAAKLRSRKWRMPVTIVGFTKEVHKLMHAADFLIGKPGPGSIAEAVVRKLPVLIECNAWTLPQERFNAEWVSTQRVGIVLNSMQEVVSGVQRMLEPAAFAEFQKNVGALNNRAVFEIPEILAKLLGEQSSIDSVRSSAPVPTQVPV
jgi:1,2-diacylglycerol 3-beta-galactosyltransferase